MPALPEPTLYHRTLGWHARALRRTAIVFGIGVVAGIVALQVQPWQPAIVEGWDVAALTFLGVTWQVIVRADGSMTRQLAERTDPAVTTLDCCC